MAIGLGGIVSTNVRMSLAGLDPHVDTVVAGLGGRAITKASLHGMLNKSADRTLAPLTFLDLNHELVSRELARERQSRRSGPAAENMLRDVGAVAAGPV
jgi:pyruvate ferredoxin oxidoreductase alpha subunit